MECMYIILHTYMSTLNSPRPHPPQKKNPPPASALPAPLRTRCSAPELLRRFRKLLPPSLLAGWLQAAPHHFYQRAFTPLITLWYFIFQRLHSDHTLAQALSDATAGGADALSPPGKRLSQQLRSLATTSWSDARQRLPLAVLHQTLLHTARQIRSWVQNLQWHGWNVVLLDGSTLRLRPLGNIPQHFPPHGGGHHKKSYWCLMRVVVGFCLTTGLVLGSTLGATSLSEQALAAQLIWRALPRSLFVGDRNLGVFSVVQVVRAAQAQILVRLTWVRARKLARAARVPLQVGLDLSLAWAPSSHDRCQAGLSTEPVAGRLIVVSVRRPGFRSQTLCLFTTLTDAQTYAAAELVQLYGTRWQVELNLRFVKTQMELGALECKSAQIAQKEWLAGLIAYNLIRSVMGAAAARAEVPVTILSFSRARQLFQDWLIRWAWGAQACSRSWQRLLDQVARCRQPRRRKPRPPEPRAIRYFKQAFPRLIGDRTAARQQCRASNLKS